MFFFAINGKSAYALFGYFRYQIKKTTENIYKTWFITTDKYLK